MQQARKKKGSGTHTFDVPSVRLIGLALSFQDGSYLCATCFARDLKITHRRKEAENFLSFFLSFSFVFNSYNTYKMSSICSAKTMVAEERFSIYDTLPSLESWYKSESNVLQEDTCLRRIRRKNNKVVSFCPDPPTVFDHNEKDDLISLPSNYHLKTDSVATGCCNIKGKYFKKKTTTNHKKADLISFSQIIYSFAYKKALITITITIGSIYFA